jgi:anhydro-N-acetylmuramic acid kinase
LNQLRNVSAMRPHAMRVAGVMSGTSADGIDVAVVRIAPRGDALKLDLVAHEGFRYPGLLRSAVLAAMDAKSTSTAELARLNWRLGMEYAQAVRETLRRHEMKIDLVGCHGQTVYHQGRAAMYAGRRLACTWQLGEPALIAAELGVPVVSNFRPADMAAGGQGAPLVALLDFVGFRHVTRSRVLQNIGGIGNLTVVPAKGGMDQVTAFDTGPGNMVIDALMEKLYRRPYDRGGRIAASGRVLDIVVQRRLRERFFSMKPPKSAGREEFGRAYADDFLAECRRISRTPEDAIATATALTGATIERAYRKFVRNTVTNTQVDYLVSGGGARNGTLMAMLKARLEPLGCRVRAMDEEGIPSEAKEAVAFALMAYQTWHHRPGNVRSATGAKRAAILGEISYA